MSVRRKSSLTRRDFLRASALSAAAGPVLINLAQGASRPRPNILWLSCEDTSPDLGCYGDPQARTPNLDRLAGQGARYTNAFTVAGVCAPSRSGIITGMYPTSITTHHMRCNGVPPPQVKCFPEYLRAAGYYCTNNVKTDYQFAPPLTAWDESSAKAHWRNRAKDQPFFAVFNTTVTHESQIRSSPQQFAKNTQRLRPEDRHDPAQAKLPPYYPDTPLTRNDWARYYDLVTAMDLIVADHLKELEEAGLAENTIVFFWGDHGRGLPRAKRWIYDSGIHAPLIIRWPGAIKPATVCADLVSFIDFGPTLLSMAGVPVPRHMQGRAFLGEQVPPPRKYIHAARDRMDETYDIIRAVRDKQYKYIRNFEPEKPYAQPINYMDEMPTMQEMRRLHAEGKLRGPETLFFRERKPVEELYDITKDPHEINNLADSPEHQEALARMRAELERWMKEIGDLGLVPEAEIDEQIRPGDKWAATTAPRLSPNGGNFDGPVDVNIDCPTDGASIAYTTDKGNAAHWNLYTRPIRLEQSAALRVRACRIGYKDSPELKADFRIGPG